MPIFSGTLNASQAFPLFLTSSPLTINLTTNDDTTALIMDTGTSGGYTISNIKCCWTQIQVDHSVEQSVRAALVSGSLYEIAGHTWMTSLASSASTLSYNWGLNLGSVLAIGCSEMLSSVNTATGDKAFNSNDTTNLKFYLDGKQLVSYDQGTPAIQFSELQRSLGIMSDSTITSVANLTTCPVGHWWALQSARKVYDADLLMSGTKVDQANLVVEHGGSFAAATTHFQCLYDTI